MNIIYKHVDELIPYINNPRKNDKAVDAVASSIKNFGFRTAILIDAKNEIINGHTRHKAAIKLNMTHVPCIMADDLTPAQVKALRIADNKVAEAAEWDYDLLRIELDGLEDFTGFELENLNLDADKFGTDFTLPDGDKAPFQQMTFTLSDKQAEFIKNEIANIKKTDEYKYCETFGNENSNGNALYCLISRCLNNGEN